MRINLSKKCIILIQVAIWFQKYQYRKILRPTYDHVNHWMTRIQWCKLNCPWQSKNTSVLSDVAAILDPFIFTLNPTKSWGIGFIVDARLLTYLHEHVLGIQFPGRISYNKYD